jgi:hypothetical protein
VTAQRRAIEAGFGGAAQLASLEEEEPLQGKSIQRVEEEEPLQGKAIQRVEEEEPLQGKAIQRVEEEEPLQGKAIQRVEEEEPLQGKAEGGGRQSAGPGKDAGLPHALASGIEALSGADMSDVRVHRNSDRPAQVAAHAFAQGSDIHVAPGQEKHLPHEAWHVVQQKEGRVRPTVQMKGAAVNDDPVLEKEADTMGARALASGRAEAAPVQRSGPVLQAKDSYHPDAKEPHIHVHKGGITFTDVGHAHKYLVRGSNTLRNNVAAVIQDLTAAGDARSLQIVQWINANI